MRAYRKSELRTEYTRHVIREAFLQLKQTMRYEDITIAEVCRQAEIGRATFYRHYENMAEVLDDVLDLALEGISTLQERFDETSSEMEEDQSGCKIALCQFIRKNTKHQNLFYDDGLTTIIVDKICRIRGTIDFMDYFQVSGCIAAVKRGRKMSDEEWSKIQKRIDDMLKTGR